MPNFATFVREETLSGIVVRAFLSWRTGYGGAIFLFIFHLIRKNIHCCDTQNDTTRNWS